MASKDISTMDSIFWGGIDNGAYDGNESFETMLNSLDFPMEEIESDCHIENWDQCFGPIPSEELFRGMPPVPYVGMDYGGTPPFVLKSQARTSQTNQQPASVEISSAKIPLNSSNCNEQATSPVSVLESSSSNSAGKSIPVRSRSKRVRRPTCNPWFVMTPFTSDPHPKKKKRRLPKIQDPMKLDENSGQQRSTKKCTHCEITKTPQWREGPMGPKTLCNACGVRYRSGRLFPEYRPAASPTFVPSLHSNSHRKVIEMRKKVCSPEETVKAEMETPLPPPPPPPPEFVS